MSDKNESGFSIPVALAAQRLMSEQYNLSQLVTSLYTRISIESGTCGIFNQLAGNYFQPNMGIQPPQFPQMPTNGIPQNFMAFASGMKKLSMTPEQITELTEKMIAIQKDITEIFK